MQRLQTRAQFQAILSGDTVSRTAHFALHRLSLGAVPHATADTPLPGPEAPPPRQASQALFGMGGLWLGAVVPKRWARRAVTRNTIRRQIHAVAEGFAAELESQALVVRLRAEFDRKVYVSACSEPLRQAVRAELQQLWGAWLRRERRARAAAEPLA